MPESSALLGSSEVPDWFNEDYVQNALRVYHTDESLTIVKFKSCPASAKGDNYVCVMLRVHVSYTTKGKDINSENLILKTTLGGECNREAKAVFDSYGVYDHELEMYGKVFGKYREILLTAGYNEELVPKTVKIDYDHQAILFEDLTTQGYKMNDFKKGLDTKHAKMILAKLAKMHSASIVANSRQPGIYKHYNRGILNKHSRAFDTFFNSNFEISAHKMCSWKGYESYGEKMLKLLPYFVEYGVQAMEPKTHYFNVLTHGDLWSNNTMFKYNKDNEPVDVIILDFQFSSWASPTTDLHYFLNTSLIEDLRLNHIEDFVHFYFVQLTDTLRDLKFTGKIPTLRQFWLEYTETSFYDLFALIIPQPLMMNDEPASMNCLLKDDERSKRVRDVMFSNERTVKNLQTLIPIYNRRGLLDVQ